MNKKGDPMLYESCTECPEKREIGERVPGVIKALEILEGEIHSANTLSIELAKRLERVLSPVEEGSSCNLADIDVSCPLEGTIKSHIEMLHIIIDRLRLTIRNLEV